MRKAVAFFLSASEFADLNLSPHFRRPKAPPRQRSAGTRKQKASSTKETVDFRESPPPSSGFHPFIQGLLETLPEVGDEWSLRERQAWTSAADKIFDLIYELPEGGERRHGP